MHLKTFRVGKKETGYREFLFATFKRFLLPGIFKRVGKKETGYQKFLIDTIKKFCHLIFPASYK
jgi:hypothetical protein